MESEINGTRVWIHNDGGGTNIMLEKADLEVIIPKIDSFISTNTVGTFNHTFCETAEDYGFPLVVDVSFDTEFGLFNVSSACGDYKYGYDNLEIECISLNDWNEIKKQFYSL